MAGLHADIVEAMCDHGIRIADLDPDEEGYTPFHRLQHYITAHTYEHYGYWQQPFMGNTVIVKEKMKRIVNALKKMGGDIDAFTSKLSALDDDFHTRPRGNHTPLYLATEKGDVTAVEVLLDCGANPNVPNSLNACALSFLPEYQSPWQNPDTTMSLMNMFLKHNVKLSVEDSSCHYNRSALGAVVRSSSIETLDLMYVTGVDASSTCGSLNAFAWMMSNTAWNIFDLQASWETRDRAFTAIFTKYFSNRLADLHIDDYGGTMLHYAAYAGYAGCIAAILRQMLEQGADISARREKPPSRIADRNKNTHQASVDHGTPMDLVYIRKQRWLHTSQRPSRRYSGASKF